MKASSRSDHCRIQWWNYAEARQATAQIGLGSFGHVTCDGIRNPSDMYLVRIRMG